MAGFLGELKLLIMIQYHLTYNHSTGPNTFYVESVKELINALERLDEDPHVVPGSIVVETKKLAF